MATRHSKAQSPTGTALMRVLCSVATALFLASGCGGTASATSGSAFIVQALRREAAMPLTVPAGLPTGYRLVVGGTGEGDANTTVSLAYRMPLGGDVDVFEFGRGAHAPMALPVTGTLSVDGKLWTLLGRNQRLTRVLKDGVRVQIVPDPGNAPAERSSASLAVMAAAIDRAER
jgi:hypothetical protein